ncbi:MAG TPA: formate dehydrogenase accessory sulfurtransferase FdhD [Rhizomicrobium sp.]|jgi:FdhD protein
MVHPSPLAKVRRQRVTKHDVASGIRVIAEEIPVAFTYDRATFAVMMATPSDIEDFAAGFSLTERIVDTVSEIATIDIVDCAEGIEARMTLTVARDAELTSRRRRLAGPAGCGLCGIESLQAAVAPAQPVRAPLRVPPPTVFAALDALQARQSLNQEVHAVHAAGFWSMAQNRLVCVREDVGRHNALDKLAGALARADMLAESGFIVMSSRLSIELVQKAAAIGCPVLVAVSAPTAFALRAADDAGMTLVAVARADSFEVFTHPHRIEMAVLHEAG